MSKANETPVAPVKKATRLNTKAAFLASGRQVAIETRTVELVGDRVVNVRRLSQADAKELAENYNEPGKGGEGNRFMVCRCVVDDKGERIFGDDDLKELEQMPFADITTIAVAVSEFSRLGVPVKN